MQNHQSATVFLFVLQPEFPISAVILASEALRIANQNSGLELFEWHFVSEEGADVRASNGLYLPCDADFDTAPRAQVVILFEGNLPTQNMSPRLLAYLRASARFGAVVGGVDTGTYGVVKSGLKAGRPRSADVVLHWEAVPAFTEWFPDLVPNNQINLSSGQVVFSAGGVATLDLILDLIERFQGEALAHEVANALIHTRRDAKTPQRQDQQSDFEAKTIATEMVKLMEQHLDFPYSLSELAHELDTPQRSLTRISQSQFSISPMRLYLRIRLQAARNFLFYEEQSIKDIATACGFSYPAAFSRAFLSQFGITPSQFRKDIRKRQKFRQHPEIHRLIAMRK